MADILAGPLSDYLKLEYIPLVLAAPLLTALLYCIVPHFFARPGLRKYKGPPLAGFTRLWLAKQVRYGKRSEMVHAEHEKYGKFVRIGPKEISINDPNALPVVYAHGSGSLKTDFYDAFVASKNRGLFNTRDRAEHTRKRKIVSHTFAPKSVREFEPYINSTVRVLLRKWDELCDKAAKNSSASQYGEKMKGWAVIESLDWFNALAFDIIGDLAFGAPFDMLERDGADIVAITKEDGTVIHAAAVQILNERGEYSATLGCLPPWIRPMMKHIDPWFARGLASVNNLTGIARTRVNARLAEGAGDRKDILSHLQNGKDATGNPMGVPELTAEALTQLIAGSDTTSNSSCAITYYIASNPTASKKLREELDATFGPRGVEGVLEYEDVKALPYLSACIQEALRLHSTSGMGLPRLMTQDTEVCGEVFPAGTILSVPSYSMHRLKEVWGEDADQYRPERWLESEERSRELEKSLNTFSYGPRSCVGRNVASMELWTFIATLNYRYDFKLVDGPEKWEVVEGFLRKPSGLRLGLKRRENQTYV
ncbi:cytochrome P450 [Rhodotorula paludigena]|uniref:cytochrome P450 n=1 Tax=Rhodotorula paludigena TaxID=86838 RepID=UPI00317CF7E0